MSLLYMLANMFFKLTTLAYSGSENAQKVSEALSHMEALEQKLLDIRIQCSQAFKKSEEECKDLLAKVKEVMEQAAITIHESFMGRRKINQLLAEAK
jgi:hypothetical protein